MNRAVSSLALFAIACIVAPASSRAGDDEWVNFTQETASRLAIASNLGATDVEEKDYAWGDIDKDGDIDLVIVRKQPFTTAGGRRNVLLMNEFGVLTDRTNDYAVASNDGTQGFLDNTNDRDVALIDVDGDTWLDIVTATACNGCAGSKSITHPRVYINQGMVDAQWGGFLYEEERIPQFSMNPNFCGVGAGDVTGDGLPELHFTDYNSTLEDRLLINDGNGFFTDESTVRMTAAMLQSGFGTNSVVVDVNDDDIPDIIKSENGPVETLYNDGGGFFTQMQSTYGGAAYHFNTGDLNNDGRPDIIISDDGTDRYLLNQGPPGGGGMASFSNTVFSYGPGENDEGFSGNSLVVDLDDDGWNDVVITDVDVDAGGCSRHTNFYHNLGGTVGGPVTLTSDTPGGMSQFILEGVHDVAIFDIDGDTFLDVVCGRCSGTQIWMNNPPFGVEFSFPEPLPELVDPQDEGTLRIQLIPIGGATPIPSETKLVYSVNGGADLTEVMTDAGGGEFEIPVPDLDCMDTMAFYFTAAVEEGGTFTSPPFAPAQTYSTISAAGMVETLRDGLEDDFNWTVVNDPALQSGAWEQAESIGTLFNGTPAAPFEDAEPEAGTVMAAVTENCPEPGCSPSGYDVDGGPTDLISPLIPLAGSDADIRYSLWYFTSGHEDVLEVAVSNDAGDTWTTVQSFLNSTLSGGTTVWEEHGFLVSDYVAPTAEVRVRFRVTDNSPGTMVEAAMDNFRVEQFVCSFCNTSHCCDQDQNGVRDDACLWCECDGTPCNGLIQQIPIPFADMGGSFGACLPDGVADTHDRFHALNCFSDQDTAGNAGAYDCETNPPSAFNVDAGGPFGDCNPDGVCDGNDAFHALNAFEGTTTCSCPSGPTPGFDGGGGRVASAGLSVVAANDSVRPGGQVEVDILLDDALDDLRGYQLQIGVTGGQRGALELVDIVIHDDRGAVLAKHGPWSAFNVHTAQMVAGLDQAGVAVSADGYLATFVYRVSDDAAGRFVIDVQADAGQRTFLFPTAASGHIAVESSTAAIVTVDGAKRLSSRSR